MATVKVYNKDGNLSGEMELPKKIEAAWNPELVYQVIKALNANSRKVIAHAKGRSEVRGGGIKPWRQKGTGRARHGSIRSPLWKGGGVTGGPTKERNFTEKINKKMLKKAFFCLLSAKAASGNLKIVEYPEVEKPKTKAVAGTIRKITGDNSTLILIPRTEKNLFLSVKNLAKTKVADPAHANAFDLVNFKDVLLNKEILEKYGK